MSSVSTPRRRWLGITPTYVIPAQGATPPGIVISKAIEAARPTGLPSSNAPNTRSVGSSCFCSSKSSSRSSLPKATLAASSVARSSSSEGLRYSSSTGRGNVLRNLLQRGVVEHQPTLGVLARETHGHDAARLDGHDHAFAERGVPHRVARGERRHVRPRLHAGRR